MRNTKQKKTSDVNASHITISLDKDTRVFYEKGAKACNMPLRTFIRLCLVSGMYSVDGIIAGGKKTAEQLRILADGWDGVNKIYGDEAKEIKQ
jgi:hypothetical protein